MVIDRTLLCNEISPSVWWIDFDGKSSCRADNLQFPGEWDKKQEHFRCGDTNGGRLTVCDLCMVKFGLVW